MSEKETEKGSPALKISCRRARGRGEDDDQDRHRLRCEEENGLVSSIFLPLLFLPYVKIIFKKNIN